MQKQSYGGNAMRPRKNKNILVLSPHFDDAAIGIGGTVIRHSESGDKIFAIFMVNWENDLSEAKKAVRVSNRILSIEKEFFLEFRLDYLQYQILDAVEKVQKILLDNDIKIVYTPHRRDGHPDHIATNKIAFESVWNLHIKNGVIFNSIREYEVWTPMESYTTLCNITEYIKEKKEAIAVFSKFANTDLLIDGIIGLNRYRAMHSESLGNCGDFYEAIREITMTQIIHDPTFLS